MSITSANVINLSYIEWTIWSVTFPIRASCTFLLSNARPMAIHNSYLFHGLNVLLMNGELACSLRADTMKYVCYFTTFHTKQEKILFRPKSEIVSCGFYKTTALIASKAILCDGKITKERKNCLRNSQSEDSPIVRFGIRSNDWYVDNDRNSITLPRKCKKEEKSWMP